MNISFEPGHTDFNRTGAKHHEHPRLPGIPRFEAVRGPAKMSCSKERTGLNFPPVRFRSCCLPSAAAPFLYWFEKDK